MAELSTWEMILWQEAVGTSMKRKLTQPELDGRRGERKQKALMIMCLVQQMMGFSDDWTLATGMHVNMCVSTL